MRRFRPVVIFMIIVMLLQTVTACALNKKGAKTVAEDDPWYETTEFLLDNDIKKNEEYDLSVFTSDERIFSLYCVTTTTWASSRTVLDTYDLEGTLVSRQDLTLPDDLYVQNIYMAGSDKEGKTITALLQLNSPGEAGAAFVKIDTETATVSDRKFIKTSSNNGIKSIYDSEVIFDSGIFYATCVGEYEAVLLIEDYSGGPMKYSSLALFKDTEPVCELDLSDINIRSILYTISINKSTDSLYMACYEEADPVSLEFDIVTGELKNKTSFQDLDDDTVNISEYTTTDNGELCKIDSLGNITKLDVSNMTPETVIDTNWYSPIFYSAFTDQGGTESGVLSCTENRTILWDSKSCSYGLSGEINEKYIRILAKADKNPNAGKEIIEIAFPVNPEVSEYLSKAICEFNRSDDEYIIRVWDKQKVGFTLGIVGSSEGDEQEIYKLIQELKSDEAPDLIIGLQNTYAMSDDILMDMTGFLEPEVLDKQFSNILDAGLINGKQYFYPVTLEIEGLIIDSDLLEDGAEGLTFEEYDKLVEEEFDGYSPYDYPFSTYYNKNDFILSCIDTKSAIEGENVEFGTEQFYAAADYAKYNFAYDDLDSTPEDYIYDWDVRLKTACCYAKITDFLEYVHLCHDSEGQYVIIGTPSVDASGPRFKALETISVSVTTDVSDGCRKFINYLFAGTAFEADDCDFRCIVTNKEIMEKNIESISTINNELYDKYLSNVQSGVIKPAVGVEMAYGDKTATDDMCECFINSMSTISTYYYEDAVIVRFLTEELAPYYTGDRSIEDVVVLLNDRVARYTSEM